MVARLRLRFQLRPAFVQPIHGGLCLLEVGVALLQRAGIRSDGGIFGADAGEIQPLLSRRLQRLASLAPARSSCWNLSIRDTHRCEEGTYLCLVSVCLRL